MTLVTLQEMPEGDGLAGTPTPRLVAPARLVAEALAERIRRGCTREDEECSSLEQLLGLTDQRKATQLYKYLKNGGRWCYDLVLHIKALDELLHPEALEEGAQRGQSDDKLAELHAFYNPVKPPHGRCGMLGLALWRPDCGRAENATLRDCFCLPWVPPEHRLSGRAEWVVYLAANDTMLDNLKQVDEEVWAQRTARNVLLAGPSGSGKEVAAKLLHFGRGRGNLTTASAAGEDWRSWEARLLGQGHPSGAPIVTGLIDAAKGGTLFIDELDAAKPDLRSGLLRIIESDEFRRPGSPVIERLKAEERPLFVFAGSGKKQDKDGGCGEREDWGTVAAADGEVLTASQVHHRIRESHPRDFWDRMDRKILIEHPLYVRNQEGAIDVDEGYDREATDKLIEFFMRGSFESWATADASPFASSVLLTNVQDMVRLRINRDWNQGLRALKAAVHESRLRQLDREPPSVRALRSAAQYFVELWRSKIEAGVRVAGCDLRKWASEAVDRVKAAGNGQGA